MSNKRPPTFVLLCDEMLARAQCRALIEAFEGSPGKSPGKIGGRIDRNSKLSEDLGLTQLAGMPAELRAVENATDHALLEYIRQYPDLVWGTHHIEVETPDGAYALDRDDFIGLSDSAKLSLIKRCLVCDRWQMQKYRRGEGGFRRWHSEIYPPWLAPKDLDSQHSPLTRVLFVLIYLNDVAVGGTTDLIYQRMSIPPRAGRMLLAPAGFSHTHRGQVPESEDKFVLTSWICWRPEKV